MKHPQAFRGMIIPLLSLGLFLTAGSAAAPQGPHRIQAVNDQTARVINHWSKERIAQAIPRDLVIDERGLGYLRKRDGALEPYGHTVAALIPRAKPGGDGGGGSNDTTPPAISGMDPASGAVIGTSYTFSATVTDTSGVKSVSVVIRYPDGQTTQSFSASQGTDNIWSVTLEGFTDGNWSWQVTAKDNARKGGNTTTSDYLPFTVDTAGGDGGGNTGGGVITNAAWTFGGAVQTTTGRIYFEMPRNTGWKGPWNGYVCSGTVITDMAGDRSIVLTAAHCVYDDVNKAFARNVLFIPDQANTSASGTDLDCNNDPLGCWVPSFGVVDSNWTTRTFPDNVAWDYAYYVVSNSGAHQGTPAWSDALDEMAGSLAVSFDAPTVDDGVDGPDTPDFTHALGYSYSDDPMFMYSAEDMTTNGSVNWWLPSSGLSGGSSGGPWIQPMDTANGDGPVISVNSWGYTTAPGMAGPKLNDTSAECMLWTAETQWATSAVDGRAGIVEDCQ